MLINLEFESSSLNQKIRKLECIANRREDLKEKAVEMALSDIKNKTQNTSKYLYLCSHYNILADMEWVNNVNAENEKKLSKLQNNLKHQKESLIKECIRVAHFDLGKYYFAIGSYKEAIDNLLKAHTYCSLDTQMVEILVLLITCAFEDNNYSQAVTCMHWAEQIISSMISDDILTIKTVFSCFNVCILLNQRKYEAVVDILLSLPINANQYSDFFTKNDIAVLGIFCALIAFERKELKSRLENFKGFLEFEPFLNELWKDYYDCRFESFSEALSKWEVRLFLFILE
jgi:COP9 signalosome complex subunit 1